MLLLASIPVSSVTGRHAQGLPAQTQSGLSVRDAVDLYARGEFDAAVTRLHTTGLLVLPFTRALDAWIAEGDEASVVRRTRVAAAFALDAGWGHAQRRLNALMPTNADTWSREPADLERWRFTDLHSQGVLAEWIMDHLPAPARDVDQEMALAAVGLAQDGRVWRRLASVIVPKARALIGDHPRLRLADVIARTNHDLGPLRNPSRPSRLGVLRDEGPVRTTSRDIGKAIDAFAGLLSEPTLTGEVELRIGYLEMRRRQWAAALPRFDRARQSVTEPILRATSDYFAGFAHEVLGDVDAAIEAYRRALGIVPDMRNVATQLAALLYLRGERSDGYGILDRALNARPAPLDLLFVFERADARLIPGRIERLRKALQ